MAAGTGLELAAVGAKVLKSPNEPKGSLLMPTALAPAEAVDVPGVVALKELAKGSAPKPNTDPAAPAEELLMGEVLANGSLQGKQDSAR